MADLTKQLSDYRLTTAKILYHLPDYHEILQEFLWQDYDIAPHFPQLKKFVNFWIEEIEGPLHSVYIAQRNLITPGDYRFAEWESTLQ